MKSRIAANKVLVDSNTIENNLMIERDDNGCVRRMVCITDLQVEPSSTSFYNRQHVWVGMLCISYIYSITHIEVCQ